MRPFAPEPSRSAGRLGPGLSNLSISDDAMCHRRRGSIPHPEQSLCTLRNHCRQWPRNTRYQADATPYLGRTFTSWIAPALCWRTYSTTSSAIASTPAGMARPSDFAVFRLMKNSNFVGCSIGKSAGLALLAMRST
jgi:hypothetical protein